MLAETLDKLIQEEIDKGIEEYKKDYLKTSNELKRYKSGYEEKVKEVKSLMALKDQMNEFKTFQDLINQNNIEYIVSHLNLEQQEIDFNGMDADRIPVWFKLLCTYYRDKERLFTLMDMLNIEYPIWAKSFKMPFDYGKEELDLVFNHMGKMYVCNGQIFSGNMGFYYTYQNRYKGELKLLFNRESYVEIPWNLLLQNPLLTTDEYFSKIIKVLQDKSSHSEYFFMIQNYQELTDDQINMMVEQLPTTHFYDYHTNFLSKNKGIFKIRKDLAVKFKDRIRNNHYSEFHYLNYPVDMQKEFVLNESDRHSRYGFELVQSMDISNKEKVQLLSEIALKLLGSIDDE
ncbi:hypothetical protein [Bacillus sp. T33-2]|uniref:hypothetical protein n=1 Tax=Bacillus sp. T33-2 TaxID=2054168 RepID=UPI000C781E4B|nr:hypothetical protein [Bacillus sp. T33-2]PLR99543.1 hypothetical protein CVD19_00335 [Bacillus sp. T33-2]